jgi:DNA-binding NarL/FixJ family response regulator
MSKRTTLRILIVSARDSERERLRDLIKGYRGCQVVGAPLHANSILTVVAETKPDVAIVDCANFDTIALGVCHLMMRFHPKMQLLLHTDRTSRQSTTDAVREGVRAIVLRSGSDKHLLPALEALADRRPYWEEAVDDGILDELLEQGPRPTPASLTHLERMVLQLTAEGYPAKEAAIALKVSTETIERTRTRLRRKLGVRSVSDLARYAFSQ